MVSSSFARYFFVTIPLIYCTEQLDLEDPIQHEQYTPLHEYDVEYSTTLPTFIALTEDQEIGEALFDWIRDNGGYVNPKVSLSTGPDPAWTVRGIFANEYIEQGEALAHIPKSVMICAGPEGSDCDVTGMLAREMELGKDSFYWPYLRVLESHEPILFGLEELPLLVGLPPYNFQEAEKRAEECGFDFNDPMWRRATALVLHRVMLMDGMCMIPFWDSLNHHRANYNLGWFVDPETNDEAELSAGYDIEEGGQVWSEFNHDTPDLFSCYGFVEPPPQVWYFNGTDGARYDFDLNDEGVEFHVRPDGTHQNLHVLATQMALVLDDLRRQDTQFEHAVASYKGPSELSELISSYRRTFMSALKTGIYALQRDL